MEEKGINTLEILMRGNKILREELINLDEMIYSVSVNTRDLSDSIKKVIDFWNKHEFMEEKIFDIFESEGYKPNLEAMDFSRGKLKELKEIIVKSIKSGKEDRIKRVMKVEVCEMIDLLKAHMLAVDSFVSRISWEKLSEEALGKIKLLQIIPSDKVLDIEWD